MESSKIGEKKEVEAEELNWCRIVVNKNSKDRNGGGVEEMDCRKRGKNGRGGGWVG